jgi:hypothetical protein
MDYHTYSMSLASYFVERSHLVRLIMQKKAELRKLAKDCQDDPALEEAWAKAEVCMDKRSVLEEHVKVQGKRDTARILTPGPKAQADYEELARWMRKFSGGVDAFKKWYYDGKTFLENEESDEESGSD